MTHGEYAAQLFCEGYNCAQAVAVAFCDVTGLDPKTVAKMASPFGGGFGRQPDGYCPAGVADPRLINQRM